MKTIQITAAIAVAIAGLSSAGTAEAVPQGRTLTSNPTGLCQGALPAYETLIRKRPLALVNEGTTSTFVTCNFTTQGGGVTSARIYFNSISDAAPITVSCTGVTGYQQGTNQFVSKTAVLAPTGAQNSIVWAAADFSGAPATFPSGLFSVSCSLPAGAAINDTTISFTEDVGA